MFKSEWFKMTKSNVVLKGCRVLIWNRTVHWFHFSSVSFFSVWSRRSFCVCAWDREEISSRAPGANELIKRFAFWKAQRQMCRNWVDVAAKPRWQRPPFRRWGKTPNANAIHDARSEKGSLDTLHRVTATHLHFRHAEFCLTYEIHYIWQLLAKLANEGNFQS